MPDAGEGQCFESVEFVEEEPDKEGREKLVEQYRKEGRDALPPPDKRFRRDSKLFAFSFLFFYLEQNNFFLNLQSYESFSLSMVASFPIVAF